MIQNTVIISKYNNYVFICTIEENLCFKLDVVLANYIDHIINTFVIQAQFYFDQFGLIDIILLFFVPRKTYYAE